MSKILLTALTLLSLQAMAKKPQLIYQDNKFKCIDIEKTVCDCVNEKFSEMETRFSKNPSTHTQEDAIREGSLIAETCNLTL